MIPNQTAPRYPKPRVISFVQSNNSPGNPIPVKKPIASGLAASKAAGIP